MVDGRRLIPEIPHMSYAYSKNFRSIYDIPMAKIGLDFRGCDKKTLRV